MKKSCKALFSMALTLLLLISFAPTAFADSPSITFNGFTDGFGSQPGSEYTETDLFDNFKNVMPGDTVTETITFTNSATDCSFVNLYIRAEAHDEAGNPLSGKVSGSGETVATMTDFLSQLSMKVWNGTELIYDASPDQLGGLKENKLLGTFRNGETATLKIALTVPIELGNEYANRVGEVDWIFHVEAYNESQLSVRKIWSDGNANHTDDSVTVNLLKDGRVERTQELNPANNWAYTFDRLVEGYTWTVEEAEVPDGYTVSYNTAGTLTTITNTAVAPPVTRVRYTVRYIDDGTGAVLRAPGTFEAIIGSAVRMQDYLVNFQGYNFKWASTQTLTLGADTTANEIVYHYLKQVTLTVNFVDEDGNPIADPSVTLHEYGDKNIVIDPPHKNGYEPEVEHVAILDAMTGDMTVTVQYKKAGEDGETEKTEETEEWGKTVKDGDDYIVTNVEEEEIPLAVLESAHKDCLIPFLFMFLAMLNQWWFVDRKKKHQKTMYELNCKLLGVDPEGAGKDAEV